MANFVELIAAMQNVVVAAGGTRKLYEPNYKGLLKAIEDLKVSLGDGSGSAGSTTVTKTILPSTVNAIAKFGDTIGGLANSGVTIDSSNNVTIPGNLTLSTALTGISLARGNGGIGQILSFNGTDTNTLRLAGIGGGNVEFFHAGAVIFRLASSRLESVQDFAAYSRLLFLGTPGTPIAVNSGNRWGILAPFTGDDLLLHSRAGITFQVGGGAGGTTLSTALSITSAGVTSVSGTLKIGSSGTPLVKCISAIATLDFPAIAAQSSADLTITVTGAAAGDTVILGLPASPTAGIVFSAFVSAANTVTIRAHNYTTGAIDPASAQYRVAVLGF